MSVVRTWRRAVLGVSGISLLVPIGLVVAVAVAATLGGSGLGSVGQLVGGPEVPGARAQAAFERHDTLPTVPKRKRALVLAPAAPQTRRATTTPAPTRHKAATHKTTPARPVATTPKQVTPKPVTTTTVTTTTTTTPAPTTTTTTASPPAETNPVRQIGKVVQGVVAPLPLVGQTASDAVGSVIDLIAPPPK